MTQKMADLPIERLYRTPPFYHCGIDVFGPFLIRHGKRTRANTGTQKIRVLMFTCMYSRGIHLETLESMDTASFKMAFQRFQDLRGQCVYLRSDAGSNFMGGRNEQTDLDDAVQRLADVSGKPISAIRNKPKQVPAEGSEEGLEKKKVQ